MDTARILVVEDEPSLLKAHTVFLKDQGYEVYAAHTLDAARRIARETPPDLVVLDVMLPDGSGFDFCRELREQSSAAVIFLTALGDLKDEERGFALGGDDYLVKPYDMKRLGMRAATILRRTTAQTFARVEIPPLSVDPAAQSCVLSGTTIVLSPMELRLLYYFMKNPNKMIHRDQAYEEVWGGSPEVTTHTVIEHVYRQRKKLGLASKDS
jgi:DNA-binding response OmpR family regulator